jgi:oxygen-dependent protoporphyrinogen oxidase
MDKQKKFLIIGGGIAGLAAGFYVQQYAAELNLPVSLQIIEQEPSFGGKILTERMDGFVIEGGPDTFIATKPWAVTLCRELGIDDRLHGTNPEFNKTYILHNNRLHRLPGGLTMMIPTEIFPMLTTGLLSWRGKARMAMDFFLPPANGAQDESMGEFVTRRLGREAYERLVEPLMSGIYAGDGDKLSLQATLPYLLDLEGKYGGLVRGALAIRKSRAKNGKSVQGSRSLFQTPRTGLAEIVEALVAALQKSGATLRTEVEADELRIDSGMPKLQLSDGSSLQADGIILATPAFISAGLIGSFDPDLASLLEEIEYVSTATISLAYRKRDLPRQLDGYGYVIPRREGRKALACTWTSSKFPHRAPEDHALLRVFVGRAGQEEEINWTESDLLALAQDEVRITLGIDRPPLFSKVHIFERAMPQYNTGHPLRLEKMEKALDKWPWISLAGAGYRGIGIPDCINSGKKAAQRLLSSSFGLQIEE